jgi:uncharacterized paraquat-inducible protein A
MESTKHLKGLCAHCQAPLEFPALSIGLTGQCPHCGQMTELLLAPPPLDDASPRKITAWTVLGLAVVTLGVAAPLIGLRLLRNQAADHRPALTAPTRPAAPATNAAPPPGTNP